MDFLAACARRLDAGEAAEAVMADLRSRYRTTRCVNVKACLVRQLCVPTAEYREACGRLLRERPELVASFDVNTEQFDRSVARGIVGELPPRVGANVRRFTVTREEMRECKRASARNAILKNKFSERLDGQALLHHARGVVARDDVDHCVPELALALMLLTGRRECEILNGRSTFVPHTEYSVVFGGQAKKRGSAEAIVVPVLAPSPQILAAVTRLRLRQGCVSLSNVATSRRYQSYLSRHLAATPPWSQCRRVHSLRGCHACMAWQLFDWGDHSSAFVAMCILGHSGLTESLVYTPYALGDAFSFEPRLGVGHFTEWHPAPSEPESHHCSSSEPPATSSPW